MGNNRSFVAEKQYDLDRIYDNIIKRRRRGTACIHAIKFRCLSKIVINNVYSVGIIDNHKDVDISRYEHLDFNQ